MLSPNGAIPDANTPYTYGATTGYYTPLVLDGIQGAKMAVSLRALSHGYTGDYALLRKSGDSEEEAVHLPYKGFITPLAILKSGKRISEWAKEAEGCIWYDQSGHGNEAFQGVATQQYIFSPDERQRSFFMSRPAKDYLWNYSPLLSQYLYGENKQFSFHLVVKSSVAPSKEYRVFHHLDTDGETFKGFAISLQGEEQTGYIKCFVQTGDGVNGATHCTQNVFLTNRTLHLLIRYDGRVNTAWKDRLKITANTKEQVLEERFVSGGFPFYLEQPLATPVNHAPISSVHRSGTAELIFWDRVLSDTEVQHLAAQTAIVYGI